MSYSMYLRDSKFKIKNGSKDAALAALHELVQDDRIYFDEPSPFKSIEDALRAVGWDYIDDDGVIYFRNEKDNNDIIFNSIALFVEAGSFIEMEDSSGNVWRWVFDGEKMKCVEGRIVFDEVDD